MWPSASSLHETPQQYALGNVCGIAHIFSNLQQFNGLPCAALVTIGNKCANKWTLMLIKNSQIYMITFPPGRGAHSRELKNDLFRRIGIGFQLAPIIRFGSGDWDFYRQF